MIKQILMTLCLGVGALSAEMITLTDVTQEMLEALLEHKISNVVIEFPKGAQLPLNFSVTGDFFFFKE